MTTGNNIANCFHMLAQMLNAIANPDTKIHSDSLLFVTTNITAGIHKVFVFNAIENVNLN